MEGLGPIETLVQRIEVVLARKAHALETINAALSEEQGITALLNELLNSDDLSRADKNTLNQTQKKIDQAIVQENHSINNLNKSIGRLEEAFDLLLNQFFEALSQ